MDRQSLEAHLARAEEHVASGEAHIAKMRRLIQELAADGHSRVVAKARGLLTVLEQSQVLHVTERDRIASELAAMEPADRDET